MRINIRLSFAFFFLLSYYFLSAQYEGNTPFVHEKGGLIINEISNGPTGTLGNRAEYIELLVIGAANAPNAPVNLEGWIIDDNNFPTQLNAPTQGSAPGHSSFGSCYSAVPPGSIIVFYNEDDPNPALPADDPLDSNNDGVYIVSHNDDCINTCNSNPISPNTSPDPNPNYCPCSDPSIERDVWALGLANDNDMIQIRDRCEVVNHVIYWDALRDIRIVEDIENSPVKVKIDGNQRQKVIRLVNTVSNDWNDIANYDNPDVAGNESPGSANSAANQLLVNQLRNGAFAYEGTIYDCEDTDAGDLTIPNNAGTDLPIVITEGDDIGAFGTDYIRADENEPDALDFVFEYAYILTNDDAPNYTIVDFNTTGDFDFSQYPVGEYLVWGFSYIQTNGTIQVGQYLASVVTSIQDILDYEECGFDANLDNLNITDEVVRIIIEPRPCFDLEVIKTDNTCPNETNGAIEITMNNPVPPVTIDWNVDELDGQFEVDGLQEGTFIFAITDGEGCVFQDTLSIETLSDLPTLDVSWEDSVCENDCNELGLNLNGIAPFQVVYNLNLGAIDRNFLVETMGDSTLQICPADFALQADDLFSASFIIVRDMVCVDTLNQTFVTTVLPAATFDLNTTICPDESLEINGTTYNASNLSGQEILLGAGTNGCDSIINIDLTVARIDTNFLNLNLCAGESQEINGTLYDANNLSGIEVLSNVSSTACDSIIVVNVNLLERAEGNLTIDLCEGESETFNGTLYDENNLTGQEILSNAAASGCDSIVNVNVNIIELANGSFFEALCIGESIDINGTIYDESKPVGTEIIQRANGCDSIVDIALTFSPIIMAALTGNANVCNGENATLTFRFNQVGAFDVVYLEGGDPIELNNISDGHTISVAPTSTTIYRIESVSSNDWDCIEIGEEAQVIVSDLDAIIRSRNVSCAGEDDGRIEVEVSGGAAPIRIEWSNRQSLEVIENLAAGQYSVTVSDAANCVLERNITLTEGGTVQFTAEVTEPTCLGDLDGRIVIDSIMGGERPYRVTFNGSVQNFTDTPIIFRNLNLGNYEVLIEDANGCGNAQIIEVPAPPALSLQLGEDLQINLGDSVQLVGLASGNIEAIEWQPANMLRSPDSLLTFTAPTENTTYQLRIRDEKGCETSDQITVFVIDERSIFVPNVFTPNNDNRNDFFFVYPDSKVAAIRKMQIFDRWGDMVFERANLVIGKENEGWNGRINNERAPSATYVYRIEVEYLTGEVEVLFGTVSLL